MPKTVDDVVDSLQTLKKRMSPDQELEVEVYVPDKSGGAQDIQKQGVIFHIKPPSDQGGEDNNE